MSPSAPFKTNAKSPKALPAFLPVSMLWGKTRVGGYGSHLPPVVLLVVLIFYHSFAVSLSESGHVLHEPRSLYLAQSSQEINSTALQGSHYVKNTYLRSDLRENQTGLPLSIQVTVLDSQSCAPIENALVEIWGANSHGLYSKSESGSQCTSWLRGGLATDSEGHATFKTIYPGPECKRAPHLHAIVRTDWYENATNNTIDSDSADLAAAIGQIFFPDDTNSKVHRDINYKEAFTDAVNNTADPIFPAESCSWKAEIDQFFDGPKKEIRAHVTISLNISLPSQFKVGMAPYQCNCRANHITSTAKDPTLAPAKPDGNSSDHPSENDQPPSSHSNGIVCRPSIILLIVIHAMTLYSMYGHEAFSNKNKNQRSP